VSSAVAWRMVIDGLRVTARLLDTRGGCAWTRKLELQSRTHLPAAEG